MEVGEYTTHKLEDCEQSIDNQECSKCGMAIKKAERKEHLASPICKGKSVKEINYSNYLLRYSKKQEPGAMSTML